MKFQLESEDFEHIPQLLRQLLSKLRAKGKHVAIALEIPALMWNRAGRRRRAPLLELCRQERILAGPRKGIARPTLFVVERTSYGEHGEQSAWKLDSSGVGDLNEELSIVLRSPLCGMQGGRPSLVLLSISMRALSLPQDRGTLDRICAEHRMRWTTAQGVGRPLLLFEHHAEA